MKLNHTKQEARRKSTLRVVSPVAAFAAICAFTVGFFAFTHQAGTIHGSTTFYCTPDARVQIFGLPNTLTSMWNTQTALWITLAFGHFSFAQAKGLDVAWDFLVGRGGQLLLIYGTYPIIRRAVLRAVAQFPVHLPMYASIAFDKVSLSSAWTMIRNSAKGGGGSGIKAVITKATCLAWTYLAVLPLFIYLLSFPTLMSIMTGYQADLVPLVRLPANGDYMNASLLQRPYVVVVDGSRIGLTDQVAGYKEDPWVPSVQNYYTTAINYGSQMIGSANPYAGIIGFRDCYDPASGANTSAVCHFNVTVVTTKILRGNISTPHIESDITVLGKKYSLPDPPLTIEPATNGPTPLFFSSGNVAISTSYLSSTSSCQPLNTYSWGFSFFMLFVVCCLTLLFTAILSCLDLDTYRNCPADQYEQRPSMRRDILDLADEIRGALGDEAGALSTEELDHNVEKGQTRITLQPIALPLSRAYRTQRAKLPQYPFKKRKAYVEVAHEDTP